MMERPSSSRNRLLTLLGALLVIIYAALGVIYWQQKNLQRQLQGELAQLSLAVNRPRLVLTGLREQVSKAQELIPKDLKAFEIYQPIEELAAESGVVVMSQRLVGETEAKVGDKTYRELTFNIQVGGGVSYEKVRKFIANLETQQRLPTLYVDKVTVTQAGDNVTAAVDFRVYAQPKVTAQPTPQPAPKPTPTPRR